MQPSEMDINVTSRGPQIRLRVFLAPREEMVTVSGSASALRTLADELRKSVDGKSELVPGNSSESLFAVVSDNPYSYPKDMGLCFARESTDEGKTSFEIMTRQDAQQATIKYVVLALAIVGTYAIGKFLWNIAF